MLSLKRAELQQWRVHEIAPLDQPN